LTQLKPVKWRTYFPQLVCGLIKPRRWKFKKNTPLDSLKFIGRIKFVGNSKINYMKINDTAGQIVTLIEAANWTAQYRSTIPVSGIIAHAFDKSIILQILNQNNCEGMRFYYGMDGTTKNLILVGIDGDGNDLSTGFIAQHGKACPSYCSESNPLNS
jgi:hypothetical protein